ncbi:MAG TPA: hypothetical protein VHV08_01200, partial [Pirellulales bacterium]|nr:hypothetical protein [Pirellulales bacterium]
METSIMTSQKTLVAALILLGGLVPAAWAAPTAPGEAPPARAAHAPGLGDPGQLLEVQIGSGRSQEGLITLDGQDARQQLVVTAKFSTGQLRDFTSTASYQAEPAGIVAIEKSGLVVPQADGTATITSTSPQGIAGTLKVTVAHFGNDPLVNFPNQIVPIFTKLGCNSGGCHGKASG